MNEVFVVTNGTAFLDWDDKGPMSTGYPMWVELRRARTYETKIAAEKNGEAVARCDKIPVWVDKVTLVLSDRTPVVLKENDPEWSEYQRLQAKFKNR